MAQDHFERHGHHPGVVDWNFNVVFDDQPSVRAMSEKYRELLTQPYFYDPIPVKWLHATILRVGSTDEFTEAEMLAVASKVQEQVNKLALPTFCFGDSLLVHGNICFRIEPAATLERLYSIVSDSLKEVVGSERTAKPPYGNFLAHTSFVYTKSRQNEAETQAQLQVVSIEPAKFQITHIPLIKQWPKNGHYEWEIVKDIIIT